MWKPSSGNWKKRASACGNRNNFLRFSPFPISKQNQTAVFSGKRLLKTAVFHLQQKFEKVFEKRKHY